MKRISNAMVTLALVFYALASPALYANDLIERFELKKSELTQYPELEVTMAFLRLNAGADLARHYHHGDEFLYVIKGGDVELSNNSSVSFEAGQSIHAKRNEVHGGFTVKQGNSLEVITIHIVDKGKPFMVSAD